MQVELCENGPRLKVPFDVDIDVTANAESSRPVTDVWRSGLRHRLAAQAFHCRFEFISSQAASSYPP